MIIRELCLDDLSQMLIIEQENFTDPWNYKTLLYEVIKNEKSSFFGAFNEDKLLGYIGFWSILDNVDIINIAIKAEYKRKGIGSTLFKVVDRIAVSLEAKTITLEVNVNNLAAINLYKKMGFIILRKIDNYYQKTNEDAYMMQKEVNYE